MVGTSELRSADSTPIALVRPAPVLHFPGANRSSPDKPGETDCNSPMHWDANKLYLFNSAGHPWRSSGTDLLHLTNKYVRCEFDDSANGGRWIEATWKEDGGMLYGWYHLEPKGLCPTARLTAPRIGAVRSLDNGAHWQDLGIILAAPTNSLRCDTPNHYFAGGYGDFSVMADPRRDFLYFFFSAYNGGASQQGVAVARIRFADLDAPAGKVWKWFDGVWSGRGLDGPVSPIFPVAIDWHRFDASAFWGPSIHYNAHLARYVLLLNHAQDSDWTQEGVYVSFADNLNDPRKWTKPKKILGDLRKDEWYPQVAGTRKGETDKYVGQVSRLFLRGESRWDLLFLKPGEKPTASQ